jgi:hypothetical protein
MVLIVALGLMAPSAFAQDRARPGTAAEAALLAAQTHGEHCADAKGDDIEVAGSSIAVVAAVWADVSRVTDASREPGLLYWRGLLAECLGRKDKAEQDLSAFVERYGDDPGWAQPVQESRRRLRRMGALDGEPGELQDTARRAVGVGLGGALGAGAGVFGVLAGLRQDAVVQADLLYHGGELQTAQFDSVDELGRRASQQRNLFVAGASGIGAGALVSFVVAAVKAPQTARKTPRKKGPIRMIEVEPAPYSWVRPGPGGPVVGWSVRGRW